MKIIIVGLGQTGRLLAKAVSEEHHEVVVIDNKREAIEEVTEKYNVNGVVGSGGSRKILMQAGAKDADLLVALTPDDELNIMACMTAKKLGTANAVARIHCPEFDEDAEYIMKEYNIDRLLNPEKEAAQEILFHMEIPGTLKTDAFFEREVLISELQIEENSPLADKTVQQVRTFFDTELLVVAIYRKSEVMIPSGADRIVPGDKIEIIVPVKNLQQIFKKLHMKKKRVKSVLMVGCGNTGYYLAKALDLAGYSVKILERDRERCRELMNEFPDAQIIWGDAVDPQTLKDEGICRMDACVSVTGDDRTNLAVSVYANSEGVSQVLTMINEIGYEKLLRKTEMSVCVSPSNVIVEELLSVIRNLDSSDRSWIKKLYRIGDYKVEAIAFEVSSGCGMIDIPLKSAEFKLKKGILIAAILRGREILIPDGNSSIQAGDTVVVVTVAGNVLKELDDIFAVK